MPAGLAAELSRLATEARQQPLLVLDEAQRLRPEVLEDLRLPVHFAMDPEPGLGLLLAGLNSGSLCSAACRWPLLERAALEALLLDCVFPRSACLRLDQWEAPAGKQGSGPGEAPHRRLQGCLRSELGIAVPLRVPVGQRRCLRKGLAVRRNKVIQLARNNLTSNACGGMRPALRFRAFAVPPAGGVA